MTTQNPPPRTIRCTADNAAQFQAMVKADPQLLGLVQSLQAQGLFPGLRGFSLTLTGNAAQQAQGLAAWPTAAAPTGPTATPAGQGGAACK